MHLVFGITSLTLLITTVWMLAVDHYRPWKQSQRHGNRLETHQIQARIAEQENQDYKTENLALQSNLQAARRKDPRLAPVDRFQIELLYNRLQQTSPEKAEPYANDYVAATLPAATEEELSGLLNKLESVVTDQSDIQQLEKAYKDALPPAKAAREAADEYKKAEARADAAKKLLEASTKAAEVAAQKNVAKPESDYDVLKKASEQAEEKRVEARKTSDDADKLAIAARRKLVDLMKAEIEKAKQTEWLQSRDTKNTKANFSESTANFSLAVRDDLSSEEQAKLQEKVNADSKLVDAAAARSADVKQHRVVLEQSLKALTEEVEAAQKALDNSNDRVEKLVKARKEKALNIGKDILTLPVAEAFNSPLKIDQIWLPNLKHKAYNFRETARFDRCTTCHQFIDRTMPGSAIEPANEHERIEIVKLPTPAKKPDNATTDDMYGMQISDTGWLDPEDVTVNAVWPLKTATEAGLMAGDVIREINGTPIYERQKAIDLLTKDVKWGEPIQLRVRRGVPEPFNSHPRLDLFVGSLSPHPLATMGCTSCHEGQGSATSFEYASHTPNSPRQAEKWTKDDGWFENHHWIYPMRPNRFQESSCLKCHHDVVELEASPKFPEAPAPKVVEGYNLIRRYGCFGCHEINGYDGPARRVGPDMRAEPNYTAGVQQLLTDPAFETLAAGSKKEKQAAEQWRQLVAKIVAHPEDDASRNLLREKLLADKSLADQAAADALAKVDNEKPPLLSAASHKLESVLKDVESPGKFRKVGPSLRHVGSKLDYNFLYDWIRNPTEFRPTTRMPRFFGLWDHLDGAGLKEAQDMEPIEIRASVEYLLASSQKLDEAAVGKVELAASAERGKELFATRGCLACHQAKDSSIPQGAAVFGPDLSRIGAKMLHHPEGKEGGQSWLAGWVRDPQRYHPRSLMPNLYLEPMDTVVAGGGKQTSDPATDIAAYLMTLQGKNEGGKKASDWDLTDVPERKSLSNLESDSLHKLARLYLIEKMPVERAERYLRDGIPLKQKAEARGDETYLIVTDSSKTQTDRLLQYVGRRTIAKYGCAGCHDIPGFEDAKGIGTALADWGKKEPSKLAFEQIAEYLQHHGESELANMHSGVAADKSVPAPAGGHAHGGDPAAGKPPGFADRADQDDAYFEEKVEEHQREGFVWQKLREPRSYDYKAAQNKKYNDRLRMPKFNFTPEQREAVITFVLGLVADPPATQYVFHPEPRQAAIVEGSRLLEKFNCVGCHTIRMDRWDITYKPAGDDEGDFKKFKPAADDYAFMAKHFKPDDIKKSLDMDRRGMRHTTLVGMTDRDESMKEQMMTADGDVADDPTQADFHQLVLWEPTLIDGNAAQVGDKVKLPMGRERNGRHYPAFGGDFARLVWPYILKAERATMAGKQQKAMEVLGWLPPPLLGEGRKVQSEWLFNFLQNPYPIRPAASLRMPRFNMAAAESTALVNYFAAVDDADYPYQKSSAPQMMTVAATKLKESDSSEKDWRQALNIVVDNNYCIKCHKVGDFSPQGSVRAMAPNLAMVHQRLRPDYVHPWLAKPSRILPYTPMPQNIAPNKPADQKLFPGDSQDQLWGLTDLLMNYDRLAKEKFSVVPLIKAPAPAADKSKPNADDKNKPDDNTKSDDKNKPDDNVKPEEAK